MKRLTLIGMMIALIVVGLTTVADARLSDATTPRECLFQIGIDPDVWYLHEKTPEEARRYALCMLRNGGNTDDPRVTSSGYTNFDDPFRTHTCLPFHDCIYDWNADYPVIYYNFEMVDTHGMAKRDVDTPQQCISRVGMSLELHPDPEYQDGWYRNAVYISDFGKPEAMFLREMREYAECLLRSHLHAEITEVTERGWVRWSDGSGWCLPVAYCNG